MRYRQLQSANERLSSLSPLLEPDVPTPGQQVRFAEKRQFAQGTGRRIFTYRLLSLQRSTRELYTCGVVNCSSAFWRCSVCSFWSTQVHRCVRRIPKRERGGSRTRRANPGWTTEQIMLKTSRLHSPARPAEAS